MTSTTRRQRPTWARPGIAAVELALVAGPLVIIFMGMVEVSRILHVKQALDDAAYKGCRSGIVVGQGIYYPLTATNTSSNILNDVADVLTKNNLTATSATVTITVAIVTPVTQTTSAVYAPGASISVPTTFTVTTTTNAAAGVDYALAAPSGSFITVKVGMPVSSFSILPAKFIGASTIESEQVTMEKQ